VIYNYTGGQDFEIVQMDLIFGPTSANEQCVDIVINNDNSLEGIETFNVLATIAGSDISGSPALGIIQSNNSKKHTLNYIAILCEL